jgi:hypothetical protein
VALKMVLMAAITIVALGCVRDLRPPPPRIGLGGIFWLEGQLGEKPRAQKQL